MEHDIPRLKEIESYEDLCFDEEHSLYVLVKEKDENIFTIINGDELITCNDYRISGYGDGERYLDTPDKTHQGNIIYAICNFGDKWRVKIKMYAVRRKGIQSKLCLLSSSVDGVYCILDSVNVVSCDGKETFVHDKFGVLFPKNTENKNVEITIDDVEWYDECMPVNDSEKGEEDFMVFKVRDCGEEKVVTPTNLDYTKWLDAVKRSGNGKTSGH